MRLQHLVLITFICISINIFGQDLSNKEELLKKAKAMGYNIGNFSSQNVPLQLPTQKTKVAKPKFDESKIITPSQVLSKKYLVEEFGKRKGVDTLEAFGYNYFANSATAFEPNLQVPVPANYIVGPGDELVIKLWGETQLTHVLDVSKEGTILIPDVGQIYVNGLKIGDLKSKLYKAFVKKYASLDKNNASSAKTFMDVETGNLRTVKVYMLGEVNKPGGYTLPAMSNAFTALYYGGGININGTLRKIKVIRGGTDVAVIDFYQYLTKGENLSDIQLKDGDVIFVPRVGKRAAIIGPIFRKAIYELVGKESLSDLIQYAGGLKFNFFYERINVERIIPFADRNNYERNVLNIDLGFQSIEEVEKSQFVIENGDVIKLKEINLLEQNKVEIKGFVKQPGVYEITEGMTVRDLIIKADSLLPEAFKGKAILTRTLDNEKKELLSFDISAALKDDPVQNIKLVTRDVITIYNEKRFFPERSVEIMGEVKNPGIYTYFKNMTLSELIILAGGLTDSATTKSIEIAKFDKESDKYFYRSQIVDLPENYWKINTKKDFKLDEYAKVTVKPNPDQKDKGVVKVSGEIKYPSTYTILEEGEKLSSFIQRAGGFTKFAYTDGIYIKRRNEFATRQSDSTSAKVDSLNMKVNQNFVIVNKNILNYFSERIPIFWDKILNDKSSTYDVIVEPGDEIVVSNDNRMVQVIGEVGLPRNVPYKPGESLDYYIMQAGHFTSKAAEGKEIVLKPNGSKWTPSGFFLIPDDEIPSGSVIIVPGEVKETISTWPVVRDIVSVVSSAAVLYLTIKNATK